ncbi:uncharacterized protein LOC108116570 [Drosophila eugracilis]|uniref:uncharacterized protein LOC108116570 n=1 Tax=Drosophila eugracilis TaxID=29029 RepID=UPI0007E693E3|nr:uncharacterized protein LOC108116570 [Drosophila eugracilis]
MVNIHGCTRMMVNRCIELLRARIECASTRHIARRYQLSQDQGKIVNQNMPLEQVVREREKADIYKKNKRRSMWEQDEGHGGRVPGRDDQERFDDEQYKPRELEARNYDCTWINFPESVAAKQTTRRNFLEESEDETPRRRRTQETRPNTAKPFDDEARAFINQWDTNMDMINRNRFARASDRCPPPTISTRMSNAYRTRKRQFFY